jgi:hypothetical protein
MSAQDWIVKIGARYIAPTIGMRRSERVILTKHRHLAEGFKTKDLAMDVRDLVLRTDARPLFQQGIGVMVFVILRRGRPPEINPGPSPCAHCGVYRQTSCKQNCLARLARERAVK